jgi:hypothetical protein
VELLGEGAAGMLDDRIGGVDQPAGAADMTDPGLAELEGSEGGVEHGEVEHRRAPSENGPGTSFTPTMVYRSNT